MKHSLLRISIACCIAALAAGCGGGGGGNTASQGPTATPQATNAAPQISVIAGQSVDEDGTAEVSFTVSDSETAADALKVSVTAENSSLLPASSFALSGSGATRTLEIFPAENQSGSSVEYKIGDHTFPLPPRYTRSHQRCRPAALTFRWPNEEKRQARSVQPGNGDRFIITETGELKLARE